MKRGQKILINVLVIIALLIAVGGGVFWYMMGQPMYQPGMVREGKDLRSPLYPPEQQDDPQYWRVEEDIWLYHFSQGNGRAVLVIHGGPGAPDQKPWRGLEALANRYHIHYYHQRGSGDSTRPVENFTSGNAYENMKILNQSLGMGAQIADIERIRQILGEEKLILIGHSFGGFIASMYAAEFPEHVDALVLIAPADMLVMPQDNGGLFQLVADRLPAEMKDEYDAYLEEYLNFNDLFSKDEAELEALNREFARYYQAAVDFELPEGGGQGGWVVQGMYVSLGTRHNYSQALGAVRAPVLVIHGARDLQTEEASYSYVKAFPNAQFAVLENAGHFPFEETPEAFSALLDEFLK